MDHPSVHWKDSNADKLIGTKADLKTRNRHFRFKPLVDENDYFQCFLWELYRTEIYLKLKTSKDGSNFPFNVSGFPDKPYLSFSPAVRTRWKFAESLNIIPAKERERFNNLLQPHLGSTEEIEIGGDENTSFVCHTPTLKIPLEIHIHPFWNAKKLNRLFKEQVLSILSKVKQNQKELESKGHKVLEIIDKQTIRTIQKQLKLLGHFRLLYCVKLKNGWKQGYSGSSDDHYWDEPTLLRDIKKNLPQFKSFLSK